MCARGSDYWHCIRYKFSIDKHRGQVLVTVFAYCGFANEDRVPGRIIDACRACFGGDMEERVGEGGSQYTYNCLWEMNERKFTEWAS